MSASTLRSHLRGQKDSWSLGATLALPAVQRQPDGSKQEVEIQTRRNSWVITNQGVDRQAVIKAYEAHVQTPVDRQKFEEKNSQLVALRDQIVSSLKREQLQTQLSQREQLTHTNQR